MIDIMQSLFHSRELNKLKRAQSLKDQKQDVRAIDVQSRLHELEQRHEQLKLTTLALWSLLRDHTGLLESDLKQYVEQIDRLDGKQDGRVSVKETLSCKGCRRKILAKSLTCPYCGAELHRKTAFSGL